VRVNGEEPYEFIDRGDESHGATYTRGHVAFQQRDPGSRVEVRKVEGMELPESSRSGHRPRRGSPPSPRPFVRSLGPRSVRLEARACVRHDSPADPSGPSTDSGRGPATPENPPS
jgi:hypothetical protein